jgi:trimethylamine--corrinoid protein Co-methyltransferase
MDDLHDMYGCPEFNQYNMDCVQMARYYGIPCYSTAGVGDAKVPGMQATFEKMLTHLYVAMSGAQYIHYAFGLLDRTSIFSPVQAILDDEQIGKVKHTLRDPKLDAGAVGDALKTVRKVMESKNKLFARHARKAIHSGDVSEPFRFESKDSQDRVIERALERLRDIEAEPRCHVDEETTNRIYQEIPGLLDHLRSS